MLRPVTLRARLTLVFAAATAVVLLVVGLAVHTLYDTGVSSSVDAGLRQRESALKALARRQTDAERIRSLSGERLIQVYAPDGRLLAGSLTIRGTPLLNSDQVARAARGTVASTRREVRSTGEARLRAFPLADGRFVAVIAESLDRVNDLSGRLATILAIALPAALLIAGYLGYRLAGAALGPVERMRAQAARITESDLDERLTLPRSRDEISRLGRTFNALLDRLAGAVERERRIVSDASHELRTPLAVLRAELQVAAREDRSPEQVRGAVHSALEETGRLSRLADDLLVLARSDQGRLPLRLEPVDVHDLLRDAERRNSGAVAAAGRTLHTSVDVVGGAVVLADPDRVAQALDNLLANALRHGAGPVDVRAGAEADGRIALAVSDDGPGFGAALPLAFERFSQGDPAHGSAGSGLGLAIVQAIAVAHGGEARAQDLPGGGARVTLVLPAA